MHTSSFQAKHRIGCATVNLVLRARFGSPVVVVLADGRQESLVICFLVVLFPCPGRGLGFN